MRRLEITPPMAALGLAIGFVVALLWPNNWKRRSD